MSPKDRDELIRVGSAPKPRPSGVSLELPADGVGEPSDAERLVTLERQLTDVESALQYMGEAHPQQASYKKRAEQLRALLAQARPGKV
jgi:hypothetical protein